MTELNNGILEMNPCIDCLTICCIFGCICKCHRNRLSNLFDGKSKSSEIRARAKVIGMELAENE